MKELFSNRVFIIVMVSDLLQNIGIWIRNMTLVFFVVAQTNGDPIAVSLLTVVEYAPIFIFSLIGGILADRWQPKRTMILGDVLSVISILPILSSRPAFGKRSISSQSSLLLCRNFLNRHQ
ncbi:MFS transporter [Bacillaceae bacterium SIJ1]|uniref:MFS transporter n=1 Tax=Litoribacterium kuwaitense TaxID=1398745 RepID=UPI0013E9BD76|nr:MFS transporter [Litoribacterium kuwaitense]NGP46398.1 MFS transporter [Litoribacterium kuwaitense]